MFCRFLSTNTTAMNSDATINSVKITSEGNSGALGVDEGDVEVCVEVEDVGAGVGLKGVAVMVNVCVLLQSLVSPVKTYGYNSNWFVALGLQQLEAAELMLKVFQGKEVKWYVTKIELTLNS
ncbi:MAG: hypothetical protein ABSA75_13860 [Candidatus Bathyarchaeia archaeon]|jgi:hypothetical protein